MDSTGIPSGGMMFRMSKRSTLQVSLTPELQRLVNDKIATGLYESASDVVRDGLRMIEQRDRLIAIEELRAKIEVGWRQSQRGEARDGPPIFEMMRQKLRDTLRSGRKVARRRSA
jgi:antitoxin ParD1/3/4